MKKAPKKKQEKKDFSVFTPKILKAMADVCTGDREKIYSHLLDLVEIRRFDLGRAWYNAQSGLSSLETQEWVREQKSEAIKTLNIVMKNADNLCEIISKFDLQKPSVCVTGLELDLHMYVYSDADKGKDINERNYEIRIAEWEQFVDGLKKHIEMFKEIKNNILKKKKSGRPNHLKGLTEFAYQLAKLYEAATTKKFTVNDIRSEGVPIIKSEGMKFVEQGLPVINIPLPSYHESYKELLSATKYTPSNIQNSCAAAAKRLRRSEKP